MKKFKFIFTFVAIVSAIGALAQEEPVDPQLAVYVNRMSDYLYVLACRINHLAGVEENLWKKMV